MAKPKIKQAITEAKQVLKDLMKTHLAGICDRMIEQVVKNLENLPESKRHDAVVGIEPRGVREYRAALLAASAVIAADALESARKEVPAAKKVQLAEKIDSIRLGEFEDLPAQVRNKLKRRVDAIVDKQISDITGNVNFQFQHSVDSTDSIKVIKADMDDDLTDWLNSSSIEAGAGTMASQTINEVRHAFFFDEETLKEIDAFEFMNEDPVSPICNDLAGTIFSHDDPDFERYTPPLHFNCKSWIRPILKGNLGNKEIDRLKPSKKSLEDSIQFGEHFCCDHHKSFEV